MGLGNLRWKAPPLGNALHSLGAPAFERLKTLSTENPCLTPAGRGMLPRQKRCRCANGAAASDCDRIGRRAAGGLMAGAGLSLTGGGRLSAPEEAR